MLGLTLQIPGMIDRLSYELGVYAGVGLAELDFKAISGLVNWCYRDTIFVGRLPR